MVVKLTGKVNNVQVEFTRISRELWETIVPKSLDGQYIVELTAYDEAGNFQYTTKYLLEIDYAALCVHLIPLTKYIIQVIDESCSRKKRGAQNMIRLMKGESRTIKFFVHSTKEETFSILEARYIFELYGEKEAEGACTIYKEEEKNYLILTLEPEEIGTYMLEITFKIGSETLKERIEVEVK